MSDRFQVCGAEPNHHEFLDYYVTAICEVELITGSDEKKGNGPIWTACTWVLCDVKRCL